MVHTLADVTATTNTNVPLQTASKNVSWVRIQSPTGNTAARAGDTNISATQGQILLATGEVYFPPCGNTASYDLSQIFVRGASSEKFPVIYGTV